LFTVGAEQEKKKKNEDGQIKRIILKRFVLLKYVLNEGQERG
jgi:hypothetical protein